MTKSPHMNPFAARAVAILPTGIVTLSLDGRVLYANECALTMLGGALALGEPLSLSLIDAQGNTIPSDETPFAKAVLSLHSQGTVRVGLAMGERPVSWLDMNVVIEPSLRDSGEERVLFLSLSDRSEDVAREQAVRTSEAHLRSIIESAPNVMITADLNYNIQFINRVYPPSTSPAEVIGTSLFRYMAPGDAARARECIDHTCRTGEITWYEVKVIDPFEGRSYSTHVGPIREGGKIVGITLVTWDVTDRVLLQARLMAADRLATVGTLAAGVGHEVNNPLMYVLANLKWAAKSLRETQSEQDAHMRERIDAALEGVEIIQEIVRDLRRVAQDDERECVAVDLQQTLESSLRMTEHQIVRRARIVRDYGAIPLITAPEARLGQVFMNLLVNAAQAMPEDRFEQNEIRVSTRTDELGNAVVEISDTGTGISEEVVGRIFEPFVTTKAPDLGSGLGLYMCHRLVTDLRGSIGVVQSSPEGTTFRVTLPSQNA